MRNVFLSDVPKILVWGLLPLLLLLFMNCSKEELVLATESDDDEPKEQVHEIKNVVIVVIDGPRYTDTWGDTTYKYIPVMGKKLAKSGMLFTNFYNTGVTFTNPGHTAILSGFNQQLNNAGYELPRYPSLLQVWLQQTNSPATAAWLITSKGKLNIVANTEHPEWKDKFLPSVNCGDLGKGRGTRKDSLTMAEIKTILPQYTPNLVVINFMEPDVSGHMNSWSGYLKGIQDTDRYVGEIWELLQGNNFYKDKTMLLVTNDHGRHRDGHLDGFISHGDDCNDCRHISLFALSPNFRSKKIVGATYEQPDIAVTVAKILGFTMPYAQGKLIKELQ